MLQIQIKPAQIVPYITLDALLAGYLKEPVLDLDCIIPEEKEAVTRIKKGIPTTEKESSVADLGYKITALLQEKLGITLEDTLLCYMVEEVQNIDQHCCGRGNLRFYTTKKQDKLIGMLEFNAQNGFQGDEVAKYIEDIQEASAFAKARQSGKLVTNLDMEDPSFHWGTYWLLLRGNIDRIGIVDVNGKPYSFFEYNLEETHAPQ